MICPTCAGSGRPIRISSSARRPRWCKQCRGAGVMALVAPADLEAYHQAAHEGQRAARRLEATRRALGFLKGREAATTGPRRATRGRAVIRYESAARTAAEIGERAAQAIRAPYTGKNLREAVDRARRAWSIGAAVVAARREGVIGLIIDSEPAEAIDVPSFEGVEVERVEFHRAETVDEPIATGGEA